MTIALDAMGGDHGPSVVVPAAVKALGFDTDTTYLLVGDETQIKQHLKGCGIDEHERLKIHHTTQVVAMDELPSVALRTKKDSSMRVAINLVKEKSASACVSAGNTGALMITARFILKTLPGIDRPAIISYLPTIHEDRPVRVLDLGANVDCSASVLFQFAVMGSVLCEAVDGVDNPRVGLLNIGEEEIKGNELIKETAEMLSKNSKLNYIGYVEGNNISQGMADVIVCDGFTGNVALKTAEGTANLIAHFIRQAFTRNVATKLAGLIAKPVLRILQKRLDPARYNGASMIGLRGIVIKSHGGANELAFASAIKEALKQVREDVPGRVRDEVGTRLQGNISS